MIFSIHIISSLLPTANISLLYILFCYHLNRDYLFLLYFLPLQNLVCRIDRCVCHLFGRLCRCSCHHTFFDQLFPFWRTIDSVYKNPFSCTLAVKSRQSSIAAGSFNPMTTSMFWYSSIILSTLGSARSICP